MEAIIERIKKEVEEEIELEETEILGWKDDYCDWHDCQA